jgi:hypothetical protein
MSLRTNSHAALAALVVVGASATPLLGQSVFDPQGGEFAIAGALSGEQVHARLALDQSGGYLVWQDNFIDGSGLGIGATRLGSSFNPEFSAVRINLSASGNQENPDVALLTHGGAAIVWQGEVGATRRIFAQLLRPDGTLRLASDLAVSSTVGGMKLNPRIAGLPTGGAVITWGSMQQDDSENPNRIMARMQGVYARVLNSEGGFATAEFQVNQRVRYNQRNPSVASLADGRLVFVWVSEGEETVQQDALGITSHSQPVDIMGRLFTPAGVPLGNEFRINQAGTNVCASPSVVARAEGGFSVVWNENNLTDRDNSWDVLARGFATDGSALGAPVVVNTHRYGDQVSPALSTAGAEQMAVWTSYGQDGSFEGIYGRFLRANELVGPEFRVNTTTISRQIFPAVSGLGDAGFVAVWSSFVGGDTSLDLYAQRYLLGVPKPAAPVVSGVSQNRLSVTWPKVDGFNVASYELYETGSTTPVVTSNNWWLSPATLLPGTSKSYQVAYRLADGRLSPRSNPGTGRTWGADDNFDGLPDDWQATYWPEGNYPSPWVDSDGDGASNLAEFLAGTNPRDPADVLRLSLSAGEYGWTVRWNTKAGLIYQLQASADFQTWTTVGGPRFAIGAQDAQNIDDGSGLGYFRVIRIR